MSNPIVSLLSVVGCWPRSRLTPGAGPLHHSGLVAWSPAGWVALANPGHSSPRSCGGLAPCAPNVLPQVAHGSLSLRRNARRSAAAAAFVPSPLPSLLTWHLQRREGGRWRPPRIPRGGCGGGGRQG